MKKYYLLGLLIFILTACIDDKTNPGLDPIARIIFKNQFQTEAYKCDQWSEFKLPCPEITQTNTNKPLSYRWEINFKEVSTEKDLVFVCNELTDGYPCRLIVSNEDGNSTLDFTLRVTSPYEEGLVVLSKYKDNSMLSFKREDIEDQEFQLDAYKRNNPGVPLGTVPTSILKHYTNLYIATENPAQIVIVNYKTFAARKKIANPDPHLKYMIGNLDHNFGLTFLGGGKMLSFDPSQDGYMNTPQKTLKEMHPDAVLADKGIHLHKGWDNDILIYDDHDGMLLYGEWECLSIEPDIFKGKTLVDMIPCKNEEEALVFIQDKRTQAIEIVHVNPFLPLVHSVTPATGSGITTNSAFVASQTSVILYYSVGNEIFRYDYSSEGHFQNKSDFSVGKTGDVIKTLLLSPDESKLYVAVNSTDGEYKGDVYCFDNKTRELLWSKTEVAGEIVQMIYKQ